MGCMYTDGRLYRLREAIARGEAPDWYGKDLRIISERGRNMLHDPKYDNVLIPTENGLLSLFFYSSVEEDEMLTVSYRKNKTDDSVRAYTEYRFGGGAFPKECVSRVVDVDNLLDWRTEYDLVSFSKDYVRVVARRRYTVGTEKLERAFELMFEERSGSWTFDATELDPLWIT